MAKFMIMGRYSPEAKKAILESGSDREAMVRGVVERAGGKLLGYWGAIGQPYSVVVLLEVPGHAEFIGALMPAISAGVLEDWQTVPLVEPEDLRRGAQLAKKAAEGYSAP